MNAERCMCGATDCPVCGPLQGYDLRCQGPAWDKAVEEEMENALEHVVETIMLYGEYPQPRRQKAQVRHRQFDLLDWLVDHVSEDDRKEFIFSMTANYGNHESAHLDWQNKIEKMLMLDLVDSDMVREKAEEYAAEKIGL